MIIHSEFVKWAEEENLRIEFGESARYHAVLCDPPYGLEFMGKEWDAPQRASSFPKQGTLGGFSDGNKPSFARKGKFMGRYQEWVESWGEALLPLLYPGALVFCFGGTRTWHRLACGMEDAGFQMWDTLMWLHGQGFPKAQDISKLIDVSNGDERKVVGTKQITGGMISGRRELKGTGSESWHRPWMDDVGAYEKVRQITAPGSENSTPWSGHKTCALKPAWEPVLCFKAPSGGRTYAELAAQYGSGCLNVDGGRIPVESGNGDVGRVITRHIREGSDGWGLNDQGDTTVEVIGKSGRYPANLVLDEEAARLLDEKTGDLTSGANPTRRNSDKTREIYGTFVGHDCNPARGQDSGGASRFFYCAKASRSEREEGLENSPSVAFGQSNAAQAAIARGEGYENSGMGVNSVKQVKNNHPTVKPIDLCRWLATLLLPPDSVKPRRLLVPFSGSGSEVMGALRAGWDEVVGIEQDEGYRKIAEARIAAEKPPLIR